MTEENHPLGGLQGKILGHCRLKVVLGSKNNSGAIYFRIFTENTCRNLKCKPVLIGLHHSGKYPSYNWIEIMSLWPPAYCTPTNSVTDLALSDVTRRLVQYLADLIPPGGHLMAEYDSRAQQDTALSLAMDIPPAITPLGYLLFSVGCGSAFRDWYFSEGGSEGPRKLQGYKALNQAHARQKMARLVGELAEFIKRPLPADNRRLHVAARERALRITGKYRSEGIVLQPEDFEDNEAGY